MIRHVTFGYLISRTVLEVICFRVVRLRVRVLLKSINAISYNCFIHLIHEIYSFCVLIRF